MTTNIQKQMTNKKIPIPSYGKEYIYLKTDPKTMRSEQSDK